jgi:hypothetical protein
LLLYSSHLPLGVPNGLDIQLGTNSFLAPSSQQSKDSRDKYPMDYLERARELPNHLTHFLAERNARKKAAQEQRRSAKGASSGRAAGSST